MILLTKKALIAMSGGVDSSVAAYLTKLQNYDSVGIMMKLFDNDDVNSGDDISSSTLNDAQDARIIAHAIGIPFYVYDYTNDFKEQVINRFVEAYQTGLTPNPCIECNRHIKFEKLFQIAKQLEVEYLITGHYANIEYSETTGRYLLKKAFDKSKDQSYVLYSLTQEQLAQTIFPLGELNKSQVREIANRQGFINADKSDSQDICFVCNGDYAGFIEFMCAIFSAAACYDR
jgi:tRNA-specific 2-thiouridylase